MLPLPAQTGPVPSVKVAWDAVSPKLQSAVETWLGCPISTVTSLGGGYTPAVAARLCARDGRRYFIKAAGPQPRPGVANIQRQEGSIVGVLPESAPVPRLLWRYDDGEWVAMIFEYIDGRCPGRPWTAEDLRRVIDGTSLLSQSLTPSPLGPPAVGTAGEVFARTLCGWGRLREELSQTGSRIGRWGPKDLAALAEIESTAPDLVAGNTLLHFCVRSDNILLTPDRVWFVDWPSACVGAPWVDVVLFAPTVTLQGGPPPEHVIADSEACQRADPDAITAVVAAFSGFLVRQAMLPPPPASPTLRPFQAALGAVATEWAAQRAGLSLSTLGL